VTTACGVVEHSSEERVSDARFLSFWTVIYGHLVKFIPIYDTEVYFFYGQLKRKSLE